MTWEYCEKTKQLFMDAVHGRAGHPHGRDRRTRTASASTARSPAATPCASPSASSATRPTRSRIVIVEARYLTFGCTSAIAASEALCAIIETGRFTPVAGAQGHQPGHRGLPRRAAGGQDPLLGDGCRGARGRGLQLGPEARRGPGGAGARHDPGGAGGRAASSASASASPSPTCAARSRSWGCARSRRSPTPSRPAAPAWRATTPRAGCRTSSTTSGAASPRPVAGRLPSVPEAHRARRGHSRSPLPTSSPSRWSECSSEDDPAAPQGRRRRPRDRRHQGHDWSTAGSPGRAPAARAPPAP